MCKKLRKETSLFSEIADLKKKNDLAGFVYYCSFDEVYLR